MVETPAGEIVFIHPPGGWTDPQRGKITLQAYAEKWITQRPNLRARTVELYRWLLAKHIGPYLGRAPIGKISPEMVREWRAEPLSRGVSVSATAKAYRLLRAVLMTAAEDRIIPRNPCHIRGAGDEKPAERPVLTVAQVFELAELMKDRRFRAWCCSSPSPACAGARLLRCADVTLIWTREPSASGANTSS